MFRYFYFALLILILSNCAVFRGPPPPEDKFLAWEHQQVQLASLTAWQIRGRIGLVTPEESGSASLRWNQQDSEHYQWRLSGPFGRGAVSLEGAPEQVTLMTGGEIYTAPDASVLLAQATGWHVPVEGLYYWVRGLPTPEAPYEFTLDDFGRLATLTQLGWTIDYTAYRRTQNYQLPERLTLSAPDVQIKAFISSWSI